MPTEVELFIRAAASRLEGRHPLPVHRQWPSHGGRGTWGSAFRSVAPAVSSSLPPHPFLSGDVNCSPHRSWTQDRCLCLAGQARRACTPIPGPGSARPGSVRWTAEAPRSSSASLPPDASSWRLSARGGERGIRGAAFNQCLVSRLCPAWRRAQ